MPTSLRLSPNETMLMNLGAEELLLPPQPTNVIEAVNKANTSERCKLDMVMANPLSGCFVNWQYILDGETRLYRKLRDCSRSKDIWAVCFAPVCLRCSAETRKAGI
uniref:Uncharacterized protein n=1 Tax=mine drainage metagenome TaxID=410659 RepID=E6QKZ7_9ZZZZ